MYIVPGLRSNNVGIACDVLYVNDVWVYMRTNAICDGLLPNDLDAPKMCIAIDGDGIGQCNACETNKIYRERAQVRKRHSGFSTHHHGD